MGICAKMSEKKNHVEVIYVVQLHVHIELEGNQLTFAVPMLKRCGDSTLGGWPIVANSTHRSAMILWLINCVLLHTNNIKANIRPVCEPHLFFTH